MPMTELMPPRVMRDVHGEVWLVASHQQLRKDYQKLIAVTKELTTGLERVAKATQGAPPGSAGGKPQSNSLQAIQWDSILGNCSRIYPELFPPVSPSARIRRELPKMNGDILQQAKVPPHPSAHFNSTCKIDQSIHSGTTITAISRPPPPRPPAN